MIVFRARDFVNVGVVLNVKSTLGPTLNVLPKVRQDFCSKQCIPCMAVGAGTLVSWLPA